jgi:hypothetical protein
MSATDKSMNKAVTRPVGGQVDEEIYWNFKKVVAARKETVQQALAHALLLYIEFDPTLEND